MLNELNIIDFCKNFDYDIRKSGNGRWIDQKCTPDVVTIIADCIFNYDLEHENVDFTSFDIWHYKYAVENIETIFKKPGVESILAKNEYDKFFQQPMEMLVNAQVLLKEKKGLRNYYKVKDKGVLEYIAIRERNALFFLKTYIEKVLIDSNIMYLFNDFFNTQSNNAYKVMKDGYSKFIIANTKINGIVECNRIFAKVLNPLAYFNNFKGTEKGYVSKHIITYDMLMYNRNNFRDIYADKPKDITRKEYLISNPIHVNEAYYYYQSAKAKRYLRIFNDQARAGKTEHLDGIDSNDKAVHMHHIFPMSDFPEICYYFENIIALTPAQHLSRAHPNGCTKEIDEQYQYLLLLSKADRIQENLRDASNEKMYDFLNLLYVLKVGLDDDSFSHIANMDFITIVRTINMHYNK